MSIWSECMWAEQVYVTCDKEWTHKELYGVAYDECMGACRNLKFFLDHPHLDNPDILMNLIMDELDEGKNLVSYYDEFYASKGADDTSDDVFNKWDKWMQDRINNTLLAHKHPGYGGK